MATEWYFNRSGEQLGPVSLDTLKDRVSRGELGADGLVWNADLGDWKPVAEVGELSDALAAAAPRQAADLTNPRAAVAPATLAYAAPSAGHAIQFTPRALDLLDKTRPWVRLFAILGFLGAGLMVLGGIALAATSLLSPAGPGGPGLNVVVGVVYVIMSAVYVMLALHLWRFSARIKDLVHMRREDLLEAAMEAQKSFWRLAGIVVVVVICLYIVIIIGVVIFSVMK